MTNPDTSGGMPSEGSGGGGGDILSTLIATGGLVYNAYQQRKSQQEANEANKQLAEYQYNKDLEMWNRTNEYNTPEAQMARLRAAGLNPNIMASSGSAGGQAAPTPKYNAPSMIPVQGQLQALPQVIGMYQDFQMKQAQINNVKAQTENVESRTVNEAIQTDLLHLQGRTGEFDLESKSMARPYQMQVLHQNTEKTAVQVKQEMERLALLKQSQVTGLLQQNAIKQNMTATDLANEQRRADILFSTYRNEWMKMGITTSDNVFLRMITRMIGATGLGSSISGAVKEGMQNSPIWGNKGFNQ